MASQLVRFGSHHTLISEDVDRSAVSLKRLCKRMSHKDMRVQGRREIESSPFHEVKPQPDLQVSNMAFCSDVHGVDVLFQEGGIKVWLCENRGV